MRPTEYSERSLECNGWQVRVTSYRLGGVYYCKADNVSPGAVLARSQAPTKEQAEREALHRAEQLLSRVKRYPV